MRVIDCKKCGAVNLPERYDPLRFTLSELEQSVIVYGLTFFSCDECGEIYMVNQANLSSMFTELQKTPPKNVNTVIM